MNNLQTFIPRNAGIQAVQWDGTEESAHYIVALLRDRGMRNATFFAPSEFVRHPRIHVIVNYGYRGLGTGQLSPGDWAVLGESDGETIVEIHHDEDFRREYEHAARTLDSNDVQALGEQAAEGAVPEDEFTTRAVTIAFREVFLKGWNARGELARGRS